MRALLRRLWPFVLRSTHERAMVELRRQNAVLRDSLGRFKKRSPG